MATPPDTEKNQELDTFEINPLMVLEKGRGCVAVDARVLVDPERRWHTT